MNKDSKYWVGFSHTAGIGPVRLRFLLDYFGSVEAAWSASAQDLNRTGLQAAVIEELIKTRSEINLGQAVDRLEEQGISLLTWDDQDYPELLREIDAPPPVIYIKGDLSLSGKVCVAVVGTRRPTSYGRAIAAEICTSLARSGVVVVSGLARGIDGVAHETTLNCGGFTIAVLGSGLDRIYPPEHRSLAGRVALQGAVISDYPMGTKPEGRNFPPRNRIISGLARIVVVVEATESSGALITATFAADQGRDVFAVPGSIFSPGSEGPHRLIRNGAALLVSPDDLLEALELEQLREQEYARSVLPQSDVERAVMKHLSSEPVHIDEIRAKCELPVQQTSAALTMLELKGCVRQVGAMQYVRVRDGLTEYEVNNE